MKKCWHQMAVGAAVLMALTAGCAQGSVGDRVDVVASLNGTDLANTSPGDPVQIVHDETAELVLSMTNTSPEPVTVRYIRFEGEVIDMIFLTYDTAISVPLAAGESRTLPPVLLDFFDLGGQADGYLRGNVQLFDDERDPLGSQKLFIDARGDGLSTLELFNLILLAATVLGAGWNLLRLSQRRLPTNRLLRALRFLAVGAGAGLTLAVAFSTLRIWPLPTLWWLVLTIVGAIIGYVIGLLLPGSEGDDIDLLDEEDLLEELVLEHDDMVTGAVPAGTATAATGAVAQPASATIDLRDSSAAAPKTVADRTAKATQVGAAAKQTTEMSKSKPTPPSAKETVAGAKETVAGASERAKETLASPSAKETVAGAKETVAGASDRAKETIADAGKVVPKAPGSGARETIAKGTVDKAAPNAKETLSDD